MYRLVLYYLIALLIVAIIFGQFGILPYNPIAIIFSVVVLFVVCLVTNELCAIVFEAQPNTESVYITALILALIITPVMPTKIVAIPFLIWAAILAMASKYILAIKNKHIFNPAALAVAITALTLGKSASWWIGGNLPMMAFVILGGLLIVKKVHRFYMVGAFFIATVVTVMLTYSGNALNSIPQLLLHTPIFFFAFIMLTEPLTAPPTMWLRVAYGAFVGVLFAPAIHLGTIYSTPELALVVGNIFSYLVSPKDKLTLELKERKQIGPGIYEFVFNPGRKMEFEPGQYMEWTLAHNHPDGRGNRRYFTLASSPTENDLRIGVKFYDQPSSFKKELLSMDLGDKIIAGQRAGDFTMPRDKNKGLVFIAGGIGITPFRSMIKYLTDKGERRPVTLFYSNRTASEIAYSDVFREAEMKIGLKTVYTLTDKENIPKGWTGSTGQIGPETILNNVPDYQNKTFYISGSYSMVADIKKVLHGLGVADRRIRTDFFPGLA
jgi:ferredoxin-NADP reductase/Na+-translocating ferredoxin:NAD+ oxidoreductase RnfD subunit